MDKPRKKRHKATIVKFNIKKVKDMQINNSFASIEEMTSLALKNKQAGNAVNTKTSGLDFRSVLELQRQTRPTELTFSKHANERLINRNISLSDEQMERLNEAAALADSKGIKESLVMVDDLAFIVNVKNSTVVTALGDSDNKVITNIDGAVIA